jgi:hypothetical protein
MSATDEADFLAFLEPLKLVYCRRDCRSEDEIAPSPLCTGAKLPHGDIIVFCNESDWPNVEAHQAKLGFMVGWGPSPCVEWSTCAHHPDSISPQHGHISRGRVYCSTSYLDGDLIRRTPDSGIVVFERVRRHLKKVCVRTTEPRVFAAPDAARLRRAGRVKLIMEYSDPMKCRSTEIAADAVI